MSDENITLVPSVFVRMRELANAGKSHKAHGRRFNKDGEPICYYCGEPAKPHGIFEANLQKEHVWPKAKGGPDMPFNIVHACAPCNLSKKTQLPLPDILVGQDGWNGCVLMPDDHAIDFLARLLLALLTMHLESEQRLDTYAGLIEYASKIVSLSNDQEHKNV